MTSTIYTPTPEQAAAWGVRVSATEVEIVRDTTKKGKPAFVVMIDGVERTVLQGACRPACNLPVDDVFTRPTGYVDFRQIAAMGGLRK